ncbi:hypothetical protein E5Q_02746 [Mixia osmundae IAM 14324]|uniref:Uncharacterized protein n=1 Tax=Mixia osmundae (strain CBS 9802 / IAM 14324 / JCM 22182 / KY 12970) TaxID=764103 RepID=G7DZS5_MIXOS|nr:hypothetical protein E5Q_02746 [Mixia osmundae IAM 14324]
MFSQRFHQSRKNLKQYGWANISSFEPVPSLEDTPGRSTIAGLAKRADISIDIPDVTVPVPDGTLAYGGSSGSSDNPGGSCGGGGGAAGGGEGGRAGCAVPIVVSSFGSAPTSVYVSTPASETLAHIETTTASGPSAMSSTIVVAAATKLALHITLSGLLVFTLIATLMLL